MASNGANFLSRLSHDRVMPGSPPLEATRNKWNYGLLSSARVCSIGDCCDPAVGIFGDTATKLLLPSEPFPEQRGRYRATNMIVAAATSDSARSGAFDRDLARDYQETKQAPQLKGRVSWGPLFHCRLSYLASASRLASAYRCAVAMSSSVSSARMMPIRLVANLEK
jgi:hypothetical protein